VGWISQQFGPRYGLAIGGVATLAVTLVFAHTLLRTPHRESVDEPSPSNPVLAS
jgi:hypothetical protein